MCALPCRRPVVLKLLRFRTHLHPLWSCRCATLSPVPNAQVVLKLLRSAREECEVRYLVRLLIQVRGPLLLTSMHRSSLAAFCPAAGDPRQLVLCAMKAIAHTSWASCQPPD